MLIYTKSANFRFVILGYSGIHSHRLQYMQKVHTRGVNIRYIRKVYYNFVDDRITPNKANVYV